MPGIEFLKTLLLRGKSSYKKSLQYFESLICYNSQVSARRKNSLLFYQCIVRIGTGVLLPYFQTGSWVILNTSTSYPLFSIPRFLQIYYTRKSSSFSIVASPSQNLRNYLYSNIFFSEYCNQNALESFLPKACRVVSNPHI